MEPYTNELTVRRLFPVSEGGSSASTDCGPVADAAVKDSAIADDDENAARNPKIARRPQAPTKAEVVAHMLSLIHI